ncbi:MAG: hypothetical protein QOE09_3672, partial [Ilumatobacteraceae bacterium]
QSSAPRRTGLTESAVPAHGAYVVATTSTVRTDTSSIPAAFWLSAFARMFAAMFSAAVDES